MDESRKDKHNRREKEEKREKSSGDDKKLDVYHKEREERGRKQMLTIKLQRIIQTKKKKKKHERYNYNNNNNNG